MRITYIKKNLYAIVFSFIFIFCFGCDKGGEVTETKIPSSTRQPKEEVSIEPGNVYFLNLYPELHETYTKIAAAYTEKTGALVKIESMTPDEYYSVLRQKLESDKDIPTIFQLRGVSDYMEFQDLTAQIYDSELFGLLNDKSLAISYKQDFIYALPLNVKGYGIIYNKDIMDRYFDLDDSAFSNTWTIRTFDGFKRYMEDISEKKDRIGIEGVFPSTPVREGMEHLFNLALYYEFWDGNVDVSRPGTTNNIEFSFDQHFKNVLDVFMDNSVSKRGSLANKTEAYAVLEFAQGRSAMIPGGDWIYEELISAPNSVITKDNLAMFPIFIGAPGEVSQGLSIGSDNYVAINRRAAYNDIIESLNFLEWLYSSKEGKRFVTDELKFTPPYLSFEESDFPDDRPLAKWVHIWTSRGAVGSIPWRFEFFPDGGFLENFGLRLIKYAEGDMDWETVKEETAQDWNKMKN